jgi:protoporphyrin/coproporphyrin ferrochelatase
LRFLSPLAFPSHVRHLALFLLSTHISSSTRPGPLQPHLLLVNLGTPEAATPEAVRAFLAEFLGDPAVVDLPRWIWRPILHGIVLRTRPARVAEQYASIWTAEGSPLRASTERIAVELRARAAGRYGVSTAYRYGEPSLDTVMRRLAREEAGPVVVVPLFPHRTDATTGTAFRRAQEAAIRSGLRDAIVERPIDPADAGYVAAMAARWREAIEGAPQPPEHLVISFHGIPVRYHRREGLVYVRDCEATTRALLAAIDWPAERATLAFQSKFGPEPWLTPATADVLDALPRRGIRHVAVITPGFLTDGLETVEEIGIRGRETFLAAGGAGFIRVEGVGEHEAFLESLVSLVLS